MVNIISNHYFCLLFCFFTQILSFNSGLEAKTKHFSNSELCVDVDAIMNCENLDDQIDNFINIGIQYQQVTSKKFEYKKFLKQAYKYLEDRDVKVDKNLKKHMKTIVQNRINERFFGHSKKTGVANNLEIRCAIANQENPKGEYSNGFREGIIEMAVGGICVAYGGVTTKGIGVGLIVDGGGKFINATSEYLWPGVNERSGPREGGRERERDRPSMADKNIDR
jgi:hypothetical protein